MLVVFWIFLVFCGSPWSDNKLHLMWSEHDLRAYYLAGVPRASRRRNACCGCWSENPVTGRTNLLSQQASLRASNGSFVAQSNNSSRLHVCCCQLQCLLVFSRCVRRPPVDARRCLPNCGWTFWRLIWSECTTPTVVWHRAPAGRRRDWFSLHAHSQHLRLYDDGDEPDDGIYKW